MDAAFKRFGEVRSHRKLVSSYHDSRAEDRKARERRQDGNHGRCLRRMPYLVLGDLYALLEACLQLHDSGRNINSEQRHVGWGSLPLGSGRSGSAFETVDTFEAPK
jgi:hypothetical protein